MCSLLLRGSFCLLLLLCFVGWLSCLEKNTDNYEMLVSGGYRPDKHSLTSYLVSIRTAKPTAYFGDNHFCVGSIISARIVLTAAHCVVDRNKVITRPRRLTVVAGAPNRLRIDSTTVQQKVEAVITHSQFKRKGSHDIALLRLAKPFSDDNDAIKILPLANGPASINAQCTVVGWGQLFYRGPYTASAVYVDLKIFNYSSCRQIYGHSFDTTMLCAGIPEDWDAGACRGDSGGPLICDNKIHGIISWGVRCGEASRPTVFTAVFPHRKWIRTISAARRRLPLRCSLLLMLVIL